MYTDQPRMHVVILQTQSKQYSNPIYISSDDVCNIYINILKIYGLRHKVLVFEILTPLQLYRGNQETKTYII